MRIVHLINTLENAGAERLVADLVSRLQMEGHSSSVVQLGGGSSLRARVERSDSTVINLEGNLRPAGVPRLLSAARRTLSEVDPDVLHTHLPLGHVVGRIAGASCGVPVIVSTYHSVPSQKGRAKLLAERTTEPLGDRVVAISEGVREAYRSPGKWTVIHNGIDVEEFRERVVVASPELPFPSDRHLLLHVGRCVESKRQIDLIRAMRYVVSERRDVHLAIVGDGPLASDLKAARSAAGVEDFVSFPGYDPDIAPYYAGADVFVSSSVREGLPTTHIEAMAAGLPIVSTAIPGVKEVVVDGETGYLVPPRRPEALAERILDTLDEDRNFGERGAAVAREQFTLENTVRDHVQLYRELDRG